MILCHIMLQKRIRNKNINNNNNNSTNSKLEDHSPNQTTTTTTTTPFLLSLSPYYKRSSTINPTSLTFLITFVIVVSFGFIFILLYSNSIDSPSTTITIISTNQYMKQFLTSLLLLKRRDSKLHNPTIATIRPSTTTTTNNTAVTTTTTTKMMMNQPPTTSSESSSRIDEATSVTNQNNIMYDNASLAEEEQQKQIIYYKIILQKVIQSALWSYFAGDAIAAPTHWYYGGFKQVQQYYGHMGITTYMKPSYQLSGSILNKSNLNGGGRSSSSSSSTSNKYPQKSIIGDIINHGKQDLWDPNKSIHYHATLNKGENTLEVSIGRILMQSIVQNHGMFNIEHFRNAYVQFMTTPNSHNDTYASTCHRMFFANWYYKKLDPKDCPDNDAHNVDTIDGLVLPTITALAVAGRMDGTIDEASQQAAATVTVTRNSKELQQYAKVWGAFVFQTIRTVTDEIVAAELANPSQVTTTSDTSSSSTILSKVHAITIENMKDMARSLRLRTPQIRNTDEITACYLNSAVPAMLDTMLKYIPSSFSYDDDDSKRGKFSVWDAIRMNANIGGENVHRGSCLGAIWGAIAAAATSKSATSSVTELQSDPILSSQLVTGLYHHNELSKEIDQFIHSISDSASEIESQSTGQ